MIGIFDSGAGGLSVLKELVQLMPHEHYLYYADSANCPYGDKDREFIISRSLSISQMLVERGAGLIVVACNTATAAAISTLRAKWPDLPFVGMEPAVKPAALNTRTGVVGVLATAGTLKGGNYLDLREKYSHEVRVEEHIGRGFVELVERGELSGERAEAVVRDALEPLLSKGADTLVLGCTHYPFLKDVIAKVAAELSPDKPVKIINPAPAVAAQAKRLYRGGDALEEACVEFASSADNLELLERLYALGK